MKAICSQRIAFFYGGILREFHVYHMSIDCDVSYSAILLYIRSMFRLLASIYLCFYLSSVFCQGLHSFEGGASRFRLGGVGSVPHIEASMYGNIGAIAQVNNWYIDAGYSQRYNLKRLRTVSFSGGLRTAYGAIGLVCAHYGYEGLSESSVGVAYGRKLFDQVSIAGQVSGIRIEAGSYGSTWVFSGKVGVLYDVADRLRFGVYILHPVRSTIVEGHHLNTRFATGIRYQAATKVHTYIDMEKVAGHTPNVRAAIAYRVIPELELSLAALITQGGASFGVKYAVMNTGYLASSYSYDSRLGSTPSVSLGYVK